MGKYLPFAGRNAIAEMNIGLQFQLQFDQRIAAVLDSIKSEFVSDFPKFDPLQVVTINMAPFASGATPAAIAGFNAARLKSDGSIARALRALNNILSVHFLEYTSWQDAKSQALAYIGRCVRYLQPSDRSPVIGVSLRYVDRFTFDGRSEEATAAHLFRSDNNFVALRILDRGDQWHSNSGWFEPFIGNTFALNQLNVSSGTMPTASGVIVDHNSLYTFPSPRVSAADLFDAQGDPLLSLEAILNRQHAANVELMRNLLNFEMLETIGLKG